MKFLEELKTYWWIASTLLALIVVCVVQWQKIDSTYMIAHKNEMEIARVEDETSTKISASELRQAVFEETIRNINASLDRIEDTLGSK